jgi:hypothetical protein
MRQTRRHGMLTLLNWIGLSQVVGYLAERARMASVARGTGCDMLRDDGSLGGLMGQSARVKETTVNRTKQGSLANRRDHLCS